MGTIISYPLHNIFCGSRGALLSLEKITQVMSSCLYWPGLCRLMLFKGQPLLQSMCVDVYRREEGRKDGGRVRLSKCSILCFQSATRAVGQKHQGSASTASISNLCFSPVRSHSALLRWCHPVSNYGPHTKDGGSNRNTCAHLSFISTSCRTFGPSHMGSSCIKGL